MAEAQMNKVHQAPPECLKTDEGMAALWPHILHLLHEDKMLDDYDKLLRFKTISADKANEKDMLDCAHFIKDYLATHLHLHTELWETELWPVVYACTKDPDPTLPTLLIYHHYDVVPVEPLAQWRTPPFEPTWIGEDVWARGANDNKGQFFYVVLGLRAMLRRDGKLAVNIKMLIDGEEEMASPHLPAILRAKEPELRSDCVAVIDLGLTYVERPTLVMGIRGIAAMDVTVSTGKDVGELHSGSHGGVAPNPLQALTKVLAKCWNDDGSVAVDGFYDTAINIPRDERDMLDLTFEDDLYKELFKCEATGGEHGLYLPRERMWTRPTLEVNGLAGGHSGEGFRTIIPPRATAKISCRLIPGQEPADIAAKVHAFIRKHLPPSFLLDFVFHKGVGRAVRTSPKCNIVRAFASAYATVFGQETKLVMEGSSVPVIAELINGLGTQSFAMLGLAHGLDGAHGPNEHFDLGRIRKGALIIARCLEDLAAIHTQDKAAAAAAAAASGTAASTSQ